MVVDLERLEYLEVTTKIGCPVGCLRYCPQEITVNNYGNENKTLSVDDFTVVLEHLPPKLPIAFSGFCEPFANKDSIKFIRLAHEKQHPLMLFTTLCGISHEDLTELMTYPFLIFCLHLPDGHNYENTNN